VNGVIFCCENALVLAMIWILGPARVIWHYSVLPVHSQVSTFLTIPLMIQSELAISLFIVAGHSSTHYLQMVVLQEHCSRWKFFTRAHENEEAWW